MLNYKECDIADFNDAMQEKDRDAKEISDAHLYILYTKYTADASSCFYSESSYATGLGIASKNRAKVYKEELQRRGISL